MNANINETYENERKRKCVIYIAKCTQYSDRKCVQDNK